MAQDVSEALKFVDSESSRFTVDTKEHQYYKGYKAALLHHNDRDSRHRTLHKIKILQFIDDPNESRRAEAIGYNDGHNHFDGKKAQLGLASVDFSYSVIDGGDETALVIRDNHRMCLFIYLPHGSKYGEVLESESYYHFRQVPTPSTYSHEHRPMGTFQFEGKKHGRIDEAVIAHSLEEACKLFFDKYHITNYVIMPSRLVA